MNKKRILIFSLSYYPLVAGAEVAIKEITDRTPDMEFDMVTMRFKKEHPEKERIGNVNVHRIGGGLGYLSKMFFIFQSVGFAKKLSEENKYDAYWGMMSYMTLPVSFLRLKGDVTPYLLTLQDGDTFSHVFNRIHVLIWKPFIMYGFRNANRVQTISHFLADWAKRLGFKKEVDVIPNGVEVGRFEDRGEKTYKEGITLITTSRLVEKNAVGDIISALQYLPENVRLQVLGVGPLESKLKEQAKEQNLTLRVDFLGFVSQEEIPRYLHNADIFVRPSLSEGFGISFIEAMAAGLPVITTPVGGIVDFLVDKETGLFAEVKDPKSIADAVTLLIMNPELASKIKYQAFKMVKEKYDWTLIAEEMKSVFNSL